MLARSPFAAALSATAVFLSYTSSSAATASNERETASDNGLRGLQQQPPQSPLDLEQLATMDDETRKAMDPLSLAEALSEATKNDETVHYEEDESSDNSRARRELGNGEKRKQRKEERQRQDFGEPQCSGSRPRKCGCARVKQSDYRGKVDTTENGYTCRTWTMKDDYPGAGLEDGPYCRNPNEVAGRAWCYVDDNGDGKYWDFCDIPSCDDDMLPYGTSTTTGVDVNDPGCVDTALYYEIENDIEDVLNTLTDPKDRAHLIGGIIRLAAHDFMDFDQHDDDPMGMDGCLDWNSPNNAGLQTIWNEHAALFKLHSIKYPQISRADFWVLAANAVIHITSVDRALNLKQTFYWGRQERSECGGSADRLPNTEGCQQVEDVFLERMGMKWKDAVALLGAHTVGLAHSEFSGHHGTWVPNHEHAQTFDKRYYQELVSRSWSPHVASSDPPLNDWITGNLNSPNPKMMLNTDMCLFYDIESSFPCCSRTDIFKEGGESRCETHENLQCSVIGNTHPRWEASLAVRKYLGGSAANENQEAFYDAFRLAWFKATLNGRSHLKPLMDEC